MILETLMTQRQLTNKKKQYCGTNLSKIRSRLDITAAPDELKLPGSKVLLAATEIQMNNIAHITITLEHILFTFPHKHKST